MGAIRVFFRLLIVGFSLIFMVIWLILNHYIRGEDMVRSIRHRMWYARTILKILGVHVTSEGPIPTEAVLFMANHRSHLDPVLSFHAPMYVVAKAEVEKWPVIGLGCKLCGAIYVKRDQKSSRKQTLISMLENWKKGRSILIYPEGTTNEGITTKELKRGGFRLAAENGIPIVPIAIEYEYTSDYWVRNMLFLPHTMNMFGKKRTNVKVYYGDALKSDDADFLEEKTKTWIDTELGKMQKGFLVDDAGYHSEIEA